VPLDVPLDWALARVSVGPRFVLRRPALPGWPFRASVFAIADPSSGLRADSRRLVARGSGVVLTAASDGTEIAVLAPVSVLAPDRPRVAEPIGG